MTSDVLIFGAGGQASAVVDLVGSLPAYKIVGFVDSTRAVGEVVAGVSVLGAESNLFSLSEARNIKTIFISIGDNYQREQVYRRLLSLNSQFMFPKIIHPQAYVSDKASISDAVMVFPGAHIVAGAVLGVGCVVNTGAVVEHDCVLNDWVSIGPSATLAGGVTIEQRSKEGSTEYSDE